MNDLISKSALLEALDEEEQECEEAGVLPGWFTAKRIIRNYPVVDRWIPADEPPKDSKPVLLSFSNFSIPLVGRYEEDSNGGAYYVGDELETLVSQGIFVNAWMPLPKPYKEEKNFFKELTIREIEEVHKSAGLEGYFYVYPDGTEAQIEKGYTMEEVASHLANGCKIGKEE